ncbi:TIR domain-containing protein [Chloroflexota bacterium]
MNLKTQTVFIAYRRSVSSFTARAIFTHLIYHDYDVFMDVASINAGQFEQISLNQIAARAHFLLILTPGTVERFTDPTDWLRREVEHAIALQRNIVPVLINGFWFEAYQEYFTGALAEIPRTNAVVIYHEYFEEGMTRLQERFLTAPQGHLRPAPLPEQAFVEQKIQELANQPTPTTMQLTAEKLFMRGLEQFEGGHYATAIEMFDRCLRAFPNFAPAYVMRGSAKGQNDDIKGAISDLVQYLNMDDPHETVERAGVVQMIRALKDQKYETSEIP